MQNIVICDLDGTLAFDDHRNHLLKHTPRKWDEYFELCHLDQPNSRIIEMLGILEDVGMKIYIFTGRLNTVRAKTEIWLKDHCVPHFVLRMREANDRTDDHLLKIQWAKELDLNNQKVFCVFEDRNRVVDAWRAAGYTCLQVRPGDF